MKTMVTATRADASQKDEAHDDHRLHIQEQFTALARRYVQLGHSFRAQDQRERTRLKGPLMKLYVALHPGKGLNQNDDLDVVLRAERRMR